MSKLTAALLLGAAGYFLGSKIGLSRMTGAGAGAAAGYFLLGK